MRPYGLPRNTDVSSPDCEDLATYALKSSAGHLRGPGGDFHSNRRSSSAKRNTRRTFKRDARRDGRRLIAEQVR